MDGDLEQIGLIIEHGDAWEHYQEFNQAEKCEKEAIERDEKLSFKILIWLFVCDGGDTRPQIRFLYSTVNK